MGCSLSLLWGLPGTLACKAQQFTGEQAPSQSDAQQADDLKKQLAELRKQYEMTTYQLGQRIAALEQQLEKKTNAQLQENEKAKQEGLVSIGQLAQQAAQQAVESAVVGGTRRVPSIKEK
jgi:hypothetical protein